MAHPHTLAFTAAGTAIFCFQAEVEVSLSRPFVIRAHLGVRGAAPDAVPPTVEVGAACELTLEGGGTKTTFAGVVVARTMRHAAPFPSTIVTIAPAFHPLRLARTHRVFTDRTLASIAKEVAGDVPLRLVDAPEAALPHATQHDESDWTFLERLFAQAGLAYWYEPSEDTFVAGPTEGSAVSTVPGGPLPFEPADGVDVPLVDRVRLREVSVVEGLSARDRPSARPMTEIAAKAGQASGLSRWPGRARDKAHLESLVSLDLLGHAARKRVLTGEIERLDVLPGRSFELTGHPVHDVDGAWLCTEARLVSRVVHRGQPPLLFASFEAVPSAVPQPPPRTRTAPSGHGAEPAKVVGNTNEEIFVEKTGEVRVQPWWDRLAKTPTTARAARVVQDLLQEAWAIPRVSAEVLVAYLDDDHDRPLVLGYLHDPLHPTAFTLPGEKAQTVLRTPTSPDAGLFSEIRFDDAKDAGLMAFRAARDFKVDVGNERSIRIAGSHDVTVKKSRTDLVKGDEEERITKDTTEKVSGAAKETIDGHQSVTVKGALTTHVVKTLSETTKGVHTVDVTGTRKLEVTGDTTSDVAKDRQRTILGAHSAKAEGKWKLSLTGGWDRTFADALAITIAQKRAVEAKELRFQIAGTYTEKRGATALTKTSGKLGYAAKGALSLEAKGPLTISAQSIELLVDTEVTLAVGSSTVKITSSGIEIKGALVTIPAAMATLKGATVKHNQ